MRDHATAPEPSPRSGRRPQLNEVMFGSNPTPDSRWTQITGAQADIATVGYVEDGHWSVSCNQDRIGPGTIAIFARSGAGGLPPLAGFMVCTDDPVEYDVLNVDGDVETQWHVEGRIHGWPEDLWVQGSAIEAAGWPVTRSPWGTNGVRQFRNGEQLAPDHDRPGGQGGDPGLPLVVLTDGRAWSPWRR